MATLVVRTLLLTCAVVVLNFGIPRMLPGDPLDALVAAQSESGVTPLSASARQALVSYYGLDRSLPEQFVAYLTSLARGDLGWSMSKQTAVVTLIQQRLPWTLGLVASALLTAAVGGTVLGMLAAWRGGALDSALTGAASVVEALPEFLVGMGFLLVFAVARPWFPLSGGTSGFGASLPQPVDVVWHLTLPYLTLVLASSSAFVLVGRGASRSAARAAYVTSARAKGLTETRVLFGHVQPNAIAPVWTMFAIRLGTVAGGAILVERVFSVPGLGLLSFEAVQARDYPVLQALFLLTGLAVIAATFVVEASYRVLLPHARR